MPEQTENKQPIILKLIELGYLDANIRFWGRQAIAAFRSFKCDNLTGDIYNSFPTVIKSESLFTENIISEMNAQGFYLSRGLNRNNIIYIRNCEVNGISSNKKQYMYSDLRVLLTIEHNGKAYLKGCWKCTIDAGERCFKKKKINNDKYKIFIPQQTWAWTIGVNIINEMPQEGLVQLRPVAIERLNEENETVPDFKNLGINQNAGSLGNIGKFYAESLACEGYSYHQEFIDILKTDDRYKVNNNYIFASTFLEGYRCSRIEQPF